MIRDSCDRFEFTNLYDRVIDVAFIKLSRLIQILNLKISFL